MASLPAMTSSSQKSQEHDQPHPSASKLRVTILASEWGSSKGGLSTINRELAIQLAKCSEVQITFFLLQCSEEDKRAALSHNIDIVKATRRPGYEEHDWLSFPPDELQIDVIVGHGVKLGHQAQVIRKYHKCKWIQVVHTDPEELGMFKSYQNPISTGEKKHKSEVELCEMADFVVGVGPKLSEAFRTYLRSCKKSILDITPGVFNEFENVEHAAEDRKSCGVLVFGRGDAEDFQLKGFDIAGKAVAELNDAHLVFVGAPEGKHEEIAKRFLECGIPANRLSVRGFLQSRESLKGLFCEVDLALMPSRTEGFGLTGLEALSAGLPVLVTKNSGFGEALSQVPFGSSSVIDSEDAKIWAKAIKEIWNKDRETRFQEAEVLRTFYEKKYSWAKQSKGLVTKMISIVDDSSVDCQTSTQRKGGSSLSSTKKMESITGELHAAMSIFHDLQQMQCDTDKFITKANLSVDLEKITSDKGFIICDNVASGNCMFYALSKQLKSVKGIKTSHRELRKTLVQFLGDSPNLPDGTDLFNFVHGYPSWAEYLRSMAKDGTWGDHLILHAAANCYKTRIRVISSLDRDVIISPDHLVANTNPLVLGHIHEKHYVSLHPRQGTAPKLTSTKEETNYARLCQLLVTVGSRVLRETFDRMIPPENLQDDLKRYRVHTALLSLRKNGILSSKQWSQLYPAKDIVSSRYFDPTLLMVLLRTICGMSPPTAGWDAPPLAVDTSCEADISRVKYLMNTVFGHSEIASVSDAVFMNYWENIRVMLVRLGGVDYGNTINKLMNEKMDPLNKEHYKELLKQWKKNEDSIKDKMNELESVMKASGDEDISYPAKVIERIRQLYRTCEERVLPLPWCEDFSFHLNEIFTRLKIVNKEKTRGTLTEEITNMTAIFEAHEECKKPRTVLIEGEPGMGKTTYCQKLAYDWATQQEDDWHKSFPKIEVLLLLRCHDIKSNIWEAIEEQILPEDIDDESKESFFKFIREYQSDVLLVLDGLDEADPSKLPMNIKLAKSRVLPECRIVFTSRHEAGMKFRRFCDNLWEIVGFTKKDAESFIFKYFKEKKHLADKLLKHLSHWSGSIDLREMTSNPLNTALLCVLCEDYEGVFPTSRTPLYIEIVLCVLRRYEKKNELYSYARDLTEIYQDELIQLGLIALNALCKEELYIEESKFGGNSAALIKFGFLSVQAGGSRRIPCPRYGFLHKSFQEFFAGFYLASKICSGESDMNSVVTDNRYLDELKQVFLFMSGIVVSKCKETAVCLVNSITSHINLLGRHTSNRNYEVIKNIMFAFDCIKECATYKENLQSQLLHTFGTGLDLVTLEIPSRFNFNLEFFFEALTVNTALTNLNLRWYVIGDSGAASLSDALCVNTALTNLDLSDNEIGDSGAAYLSDALRVNTVLTNLDLSDNEIGDSGASYLSDALRVNTASTNLNLRWNKIGDSGAASLSDALRVNTALTYLNLSVNRIGDSGAASLSSALRVNTALTNLDLSDNVIGGSGTAHLSDALRVNTVLTNLDLRGNKIGDSGAALLSDALRVNTVLTTLNLRGNWIGHSGAASISDALRVNTVLTNLDLSSNGIGTSGRAFISGLLAINSTLNVKL